MMRDLVLLACLAGSACASQPATGTPDLSREPATVRVALGAPFTLRMGESADVGSRLRLTALAVTEESRCPANVVCIWMGDAAVAIRLESEAVAALTDTLHTLPERQTRTTYASLAVSFLSLDPLPTAGEKTATYKATFRVEALAANAP